jgi:endonuclease YncB( thermonuclease family)
LSSRTFRRQTVLLYCLLAGLTPITAMAYAWSGKVVAIHDGDTLTVMRQGRAVKLRLHAIDAPEARQPFGQQSRKSLSSLCYGRYARIEPVGEDKYERTLGRVSCGGVEVNAEQLRRGMAWHYVKYSDDADLQRLEDQARWQRLGLWSASRPQPPWEFRHQEDDAAGPAPKRPDRQPLPMRCGAKRHCSQMTSCGEALYYLRRCRVQSLDGNRDGVPCESLCSSQR